MIFFSIIIPVYNRSQLLCEAIDTILIQTHQHFEIIIVDDGSTENIDQVLGEKYGKEQKIKYFHKQNEERAQQEILDWPRAKGDYAVFFDSDDFMKLHYLEILK
jgi:glycosyltransferase involved in cell wall biosynthesis